MRAAAGRSAAAIVAILAIAVAAGCGQDARPPSLEQVRTALGDRFGHRFAGADVEGSTLHVDLLALADITNGRIRRGMSRDAGAVFETVYRSVGYPAGEVVTEFEFPFVHTENGVGFAGTVATYSLTAEQAAAIRWSAPRGDWDAFRTMLRRDVLG